MIKAAMIGIGDMARHHVRHILANFPDTEFLVVSDPSTNAYQQMTDIFVANGRIVPPNVVDLEDLLARYGEKLDVVFIITPHKFHHDQAKACLEAGIDVLLEKPMVMTAEEAKSLIQTRDETGQHLVVAFQGSLSPQIRTADRLLRAGLIGKIRTINAQVWQKWLGPHDGTWRQNPVLSGGGFMFDTGAHMLNTVGDLADESFVEIAAWLDNRGRQVDINGVVIGRLQSGVMVTLNACGEAFPSCHSEVRIIGSKGMIRTGIWGNFLDIKYHGDDEWTAVPVPRSLGVWEQFLAVRSGKIDNPSPPEIGLRMAHLWDAIKSSANQGGVPVKIEHDA